MLELVKKGKVECFVAPPWDDYPFLTHAFCTRRGGVSGGACAGLNMSLKEGDTEENISANWDIVAAAFHLSRRQFFQVHQVHRDDILVIDSDDFRTFTCQPLHYDAIITNRPGLALCVKTADCVPVLIADTKRRIVAAVHAGWRGTALGISRKVLRTLYERYGTRPREIQAAIGPAIGPCCYEVDDYVYGEMESQGFREKIFTALPEKGKWRLDLPLANLLQLQKMGVPRENIHPGSLCTSCRSEWFYSHRGEGGMTGRLLNFIMINNGVSS